LNEPSSFGDQQELARRILRYCVAYPDAKDTVEGILKWWLPAGSAEAGQQEVQDVLDALAARRWLIKRQITPNRTIYGLRKESLEEIKDYLAG
jgi:hypothetical protein